MNCDVRVTVHVVGILNSLMFTGRSAQPRLRSGLKSQKHHGAELNFLSIHLSGYGGYTLKLNGLFNQLDP